MPKHFKIIGRMCFLSFLLLALTGCDEDNDSSSGGHAPASIIGQKLVQTITANDGRETTISVGDTITYQFIDSTTILGAGDNVVATTSWSYSRTGANTPHVELVYHDGIPYSDEYLTFNTGTSGTFETEGMAGSQPGAYSGTFQISDVSGSGSDDGGGNDDSDAAACETNNTGTLTFWVSYTGATGTVTTEVAGIGSRSSNYHYTGSGPACGSTETAAMTFEDIPATTHSYTASDDDGITWSGSVPIDTCGCSRVELY